MSSKSHWKNYLESTALFILLYTFYSAPLLGFVISAYILLCTNLWPFLLLYFVWIYVDRKTPSTTGRRSNLIRSFFLWKYARDYFPQKLVKTAALKSSENYLLCFFPHGILITGAWCNLSSDEIFNELFPGKRLCGFTLNINFYVPFFRELCLGYGMLSVSKESIEYQLTTNNDKIICIAPGGAKEAAKTEPGKYRLALKNRKGFVKLAIKTGTSLVPVIMFGETDLFEHKIPRKGSFHEKIINFIMKKTGIAFCMYKGRGPFGLLPLRKPVTTVVGKPMNIKKIENPTQEEIDNIHAEFVKSLTNLFEENKAMYVANPESTHLSIED